MTRAEAVGLWSSMERDGMALWDVSLPTAEVVFLKSVLEAHHGVASVHALPRLAGTPTGARSELRVAATRELASELEAVLRELAVEIPTLVANPIDRGPIDHGKQERGVEVVGGGATE
jgi:hypothetical protein